MTTKTTKAAKTCPVCGHEQEQEESECTRCGWDFSPLLGTPERVEALQKERLDKALTAWRQRRYNPKLIPELERDPFETSEEFNARLAERPWYLGLGELQKAGYDIETGCFPMGIKELRSWATTWIGSASSFRLRLPRDQARDLYHRGATWPLYAHLAVEISQVSLATLVLVVADGELPVEIQKQIGPLISGRYHDLGDGTLMDIRTGLQWMRCALGQRWNGRTWWNGPTCAGNAGRWTWNNLHHQIAGINQQGGYGGHRDWRVPTIGELKTLIVEDSNPAIDLEAFPATPCRWFWSSSPNHDNSDYGWGVDFSSGNVYSYDKSGSLYVRLVRGGQ